MIDIWHPNRTKLLEKWRGVYEFDKISQWTTAAELAWLAEAASRSVHAGEVGSYKGKSAKAMALGFNQGSGRGLNGFIACCDRFQDNTEPDFRRNLREELQNGSVIILPMESAEGAERMRVSQRQGRWQFDLFFIDASHEKHDVLRDIELWAPLVRAGGILAFHDCFPGESDNGISQALEEKYPDYHLVIDSIAAVRIPSGNP